ncbi:MAG: DNA topoisomerase VI, partial [Candidatus Hadarchaeota archaeon]
GLTADDVMEYDLKRHLIKFEEVDLRRLEQVKNYDWFKNNKEWQKQFKMWKELNGKVELAALSSKGITFISDNYIPNKIKNKQWLD